MALEIKGVSATLTADDQFQNVYTPPAGGVGIVTSCLVANNHETQPATIWVKFGATQVMGRHELQPGHSFNLITPGSQVFFPDGSTIQVKSDYGSRIETYVSVIDRTE